MSAGACCPASRSSGMPTQKRRTDRKEFAAASIGFKEVLTMLADPDLAGAANQSPLADIKTLAAGFRILAANAAAPPPPPVVVAAPPPLPPVPARADPNRIYGVSDSNVVPPVVVRQELPPFPTVVTSAMQGSMDVVIDETGGVMASSMRSPVSPLYDSHALAAARTWRYRPAMLNGAPVKYPQDHSDRDHREPLTRSAVS